MALLSFDLCTTKTIDTDFLVDIATGATFQTPEVSRHDANTLIEQIIAKHPHTLLQTNRYNVIRDSSGRLDKIEYQDFKGTLCYMYPNELKYHLRNKASVLTGGYKI